MTSYRGRPIARLTRHNLKEREKKWKNEKTYVKQHAVELEDQRLVTTVFRQVSDRDNVIHHFAQKMEKASRAGPLFTYLGSIHTGGRKRVRHGKRLTREERARGRLWSIEKEKAEKKRENLALLTDSSTTPLRKTANYESQRKNGRLTWWEKIWDRKTRKFWSSDCSASLTSETAATNGPGTLCICLVLSKSKFGVLFRDNLLENANFREAKSRRIVNFAPIESWYIRKYNSVENFGESLLCWPVGWIFQRFEI